MKAAQVILAAFTDECAKRLVPYEEQGSTNANLEAIFCNGQNENDPQPKPSVSCGDIIDYNGTYYVVQFVGFKMIPVTLVDDVKAADRRDRWAILHKAGYQV